MKTETVAAISDRRRRSQTAATERAVELLLKGQVVALPTETVYGLAADALNPIAVAKIFEAKDRPRFDPLIVHLPDHKWLEKIADVPARDRKKVSHLADRFWPGPLTIVLPKREIVPDIVTAGLDTVAVRISAHPVFADIVREFGRPLAAPSANRFGRISPTTAQHVSNELGGRIPLIIDAGSTEHGIESTIVAIQNGKIDILRRGPVTEEDLRRIGFQTANGGSRRGKPMSDRQDADATGLARGIGFQPMSHRQDADATEIRAPGQLPSHYAPKTPLRLIGKAESFLPKGKQRVGLLAWNLVESERRFSAIRQLSEKPDLREAAANLFRYLRELDALDLDLIVAERVPARGLGRAINDRLQRAAAKSSEPPAGFSRGPQAGTSRHFHAPDKPGRIP